MKKIENYINGNITSVSNDTLPVVDPSKGEVTGEVVLSNQEDFENTIKSSQNAYLEWSQVTPLKRSRILQKYKLILFYDRI